MRRLPGEPSHEGDAALPTRVHVQEVLPQTHGPLPDVQGPSHFLHPDRRGGAGDASADTAKRTQRDQGAVESVLAALANASSGFGRDGLRLRVESLVDFTNFESQSGSGSDRKFCALTRQMGFYASF